MDASKVKWSRVFDSILEDTMQNKYLHNEGVIPYDKVNKTPREVRVFAMSGWIVGGGARYLLDIDTDPPKDWDILIPWPEWNYIRGLIPEGAKANRFGGFKFTDGEYVLDVWPDDLGQFLRGLEGKSEGCPCLDISSRLVVGAYRGFQKDGASPKS